MVGTILCLYAPTLAYAQWSGQNDQLRCFLIHILLCYWSTTRIPSGGVAPLRGRGEHASNLIAGGVPRCSRGPMKRIHAAWRFFLSGGGSYGVEVPPPFVALDAPQLAQLHGALVRRAQQVLRASPKFSPTPIASPSRWEEMRDNPALFTTPPTAARLQEQ
jgi:hypothetical protein